MIKLRDMSVSASKLDSNQSDIFGLEKHWGCSTRSSYGTTEFQGSISPNFVRQAKSCRRTAFGDKFAVQFHQLNVKAKITSKFAKRHSPFAKFVRRKKLLIQCARKSQEEMLMKSTPAEAKLMPE